MATSKKDPFSGGYDWKGIAVLAASAICAAFVTMPTACMPEPLPTTAPSEAKLGKVVQLSEADLVATKNAIEYIANQISSDKKVNLVRGNLYATQKDVVIDGMHCLWRVENPTKADKTLSMFGAFCSKDVVTGTARTSTNGDAAKNKKSNAKGGSASDSRIVGFATPRYAVEFYLSSTGLRSTSYRKDVGIEPFGEVLIGEKDENGAVSASMAMKTFQAVLDHYKGKSATLPFEKKE